MPSQLKVVQGPSIQFRFEVFSDEPIRFNGSVDEHRPQQLLHLILKTIGNSGFLRTYHVRLVVCVSLRVYLCMYLYGFLSVTLPICVVSLCMSDCLFACSCRQV